MERPSTMAAVVQRLDARRSSLSVGGPRHRTRVLLSAGVGAVLLAGTALALRGTRHRATVLVAEPIAATVLRNETGDTSLTVLGRFAGDLVTDGLQRLGVAKVVPWPGALLASEHASATGAPLVATMQEETMAGTVITGSYYRLRDSLHLQAQLVDAQSGELVSLLAPIVVSMSAPEAAIAKLRDRVMGAVASARDDRLTSVPGITRNPPSFSAYEAFDLGLESFLAQNYAVALSDFRTAFDRDSTFTAAALWGARAALNIDSMSTAGELAQRARSSGSGLDAFNDASLRYIESRLLGDGTAARAAIAQAAALAPNSRAGYDHAVAPLSAGYTRAARPYVESLARQFPQKIEYRGLAALVAARRGDLVGSGRWLGQVAPHEIAEHLVFCARVAAIGGNTEKAITYLTSAADHGIEHSPWLAGSAFRDFAAVEKDPRGAALLSGR